MPEAEKKLALVTGASRGIGAATAKALAAKGYHMLITARTEGGLEETEDAIHENGGSATIAPLDLNDSEAIQRLGQAVEARWGRLDALVLNAAMLGDLGPLAHSDEKMFGKVFALNIAAQYRLIKSFDSLLKKAETPHLVAVTSSVARTPRAYWGVYAASKAALETLALTYGEEAANVTVHIYNPGGTATAMRAEAYPGEDQSKLKSPDEVGAEIAALL